MTDRSLFQADAEPAVLPGYGLVPAEWARTLITRQAAKRSADPGRAATPPLYPAGPRIPAVPRTPAAALPVRLLPARADRTPPSACGSGASTPTPAAANSSAWTPAPGSSPPDCAASSPPATTPAAHPTATPRSAIWTTSSRTTTAARPPQLTAPDSAKPATTPKKPPAGPPGPSQQQAATGTPSNSPPPPATPTAPPHQHYPAQCSRPGHSPASDTVLPDTASAGTTGRPAAQPGSGYRRRLLHRAKTLKRARRAPAPIT